MGRARIRRLRALQRERVQYAEQERQRQELEEEFALEERRAKEDPEGWERYLDVQTGLFAVIEEVEDETGYALFHTPGPIPERIQEAWDELQRVRREWLDRVEKTEREDGRTLSVNGWEGPQHETKGAKWVDDADSSKSDGHGGSA